MERIWDKGKRDGEKGSRDSKDERGRDERRRDESGNERGRK